MQGSNGTFEPLAFVNAKAGSAANNQYDFQVKDLAPGDYYFRLKQIDLDGHSALSPVRTVVVRQPVMVRLSPNPVQDKLSVAIVQERSTNFSVALVNAVGQNTVLLAPRQTPAGDSQWVFDLSGLPAGVYYCVCKADNVVVESTRLVKK